MVEVNFTSVVGLNDYDTLTPLIRKLFTEKQNGEKYQEDLMGIQIMSGPKNYMIGHQMKLADNSRDFEEMNRLPEGTTAGIPQLTRQIAKDMGRVFKENGITDIQFHYPWQKTVADNNFHDLALTILFCSKLGAFADADNVQINHHCGSKYPTTVSSIIDGSMYDCDAKKFRKRIQQKTETDNIYALTVKDSLKSGTVGVDGITITAENNPAFSPDYDNKSYSQLIDNFGLIPEDLQGVRAYCLDIPHAETVIEMMKEEPEIHMPENLRWIYEQYDGIPKSASSRENFLKGLLRNGEVTWLHVCDEVANMPGHRGLHYRETCEIPNEPDSQGNVDFEAWAKAVQENIKSDYIVGTIEVNDAYVTGDPKRGLELSAKHDLPIYQEIFNI